jgi:hypothetical protein
MLKFHDPDGLRIAEVTNNGFMISSVQDAVDLLGELSFDNCSAVILHEANLHPDFFKLHTGLAGDILQKFSNYNFRLAVTGDFSKYTSKNLQDFIRESNKGNSIYFAVDTEMALTKLAPKRPLR